MGLIIGLGGKNAGKPSASSYVVAWDGASEPDVTKIPAGVVVTYDGTSYTGTLAASNDAAGKIYLVSDGTGDEYYRYVVSKEGDIYSWVPLGSTQIDLSGYATKVSSPTAGNFAGIDSNGNLTDSGKKASDFVKKGSWDSSLTSGLAENLIDTKGQGSEQIISRRTSYGEESISDDSSALFKKLLGKSLVWNQLVSSSVSSVTVPSGRKYLSVIGGTKSIGTSSGSAITVTGGSDMVIDLTLMSGSGNELSTVEEFEALFNKSYYAYNAGQIINNNVEAYETVGFNQYDPATGKAIVLKGNEYQITGTYTSLSLNGNTITLDASGLFTPTEDGELVVTGGNATDTCVHLTWSGYRNGEYEPYWKRSMKIDWKKLYGKLNGQGEMVQIAPNGGRSAGTVCDVADFVRKEADITLVGVDLGSLEWTLYQGQFLNQTAVPARGRPSGYSLGYNVICSRYSPTSATAFSGILNGEVGIGSGSVDSLRIVDSNYSSASTFKAAMNGVELVYPLATPLHYTDLMMSDDGGQTFYDIPTFSKVADFGTEYAAPTEEVDANGVPKSTPLLAVITYSTDFTRQLATMNKNYQSQESMDSLLSALGTAMGGTWSKTWDSTNGKWTYSFTANSQSE